jgi:16S rRNA (cytosine967-C5)-methyltransferase
MPVSHARAAAFEILLRIETTDAYASEMLHASRFAQLSPADHGLLTELVMGVLRWRGLLDSKIAERSSQSLAKLDLEVLTALRLGAYQILFLDRVPRHAAVNESVELVKSAHKRSAAGLVNAVLRKIERSASDLNDGFSHPEWLVERWVKIYGAETARKICEYDQRAPAQAIRIADAKAVELRSTERTRACPQPAEGASAPTRFLDELDAVGVQVEPGKLLSTAFTVKSGDVTTTKAFRERRVMIQDEGSQLVAMLVGRGNKKILDCCAAPGGKTRIIAEQNPEAVVVAMDLHPQRAALLTKLVAASNVRVVGGDVRNMPVGGEFDRILMDAPCSGTGTLARNPEIKWRLKAEDLLRLQEYQVEILRAAMKLVSRGGRIVYSTCSLEPEENEAVIQKALEGNPSFHLVDCRNELEYLRVSGELVWDGVDSLLRGPFLRTIPGVHPCDGFFAAVMEKE